MRFLSIMIIGLLLSCNSNTETKSISDKANKINIKELEKTGFKEYQDSPIKAIPIFQQVASEYERLENFKKAGSTNLNIANIFDEHLNEIDSALIFAKKSLKIWETQKDSMQIANLLKYIGLLSGKKGQFEEATSYIQHAIKIYVDQEFNQGIAVSEFNLADTYFRKKEYENSLKYFNTSKDFWVSKKENSRIYTNNLLGIRIFDAISNDEKVLSLIKENRKIEQETNINEYIQTKFNELIKELEKEAIH